MPGTAITVVALALAAWGGLVALRGIPHEERLGPERALLERRIENLERVVRAGRSQPIVPLDDGLVVIGRPALEDLLRAAMPYETRAGGFRVRILTARVECDEGLALVTLDVRASLADRPEGDAFADATLYGALSEFELAPDANMLRGRIAVIALEVHRVMLGSERNRALRGLLRDLAALRVETFHDVDFAFDVPVPLLQEVVLPPAVFRPGVRIAEARLPLQIEVTHVTALSDRLWISLDLRSGADADSTVTRRPWATR